MPYLLDGGGPGVLVAEPREPRVHIPGGERGYSSGIRKGNNSKRLKAFQLKVKARIWPLLSYVPFSLDGGGPGVLVAEPREPRVHIPAHLGKPHLLENAPP